MSENGPHNRAPRPLQDAGPAGWLGPVAVVCLRQTRGAEKRQRRDDPEQGRPVLDEALGVAEWPRGEGRRTCDTHDQVANFREAGSAVFEAGCLAAGFSSIGRRIRSARQRFTQQICSEVPGRPMTTGSGSTGRILFVELRAMP